MALLGRIEGFDIEYRYLSNLGNDLQKQYTIERDKNEVSKDHLEKINLINFDKKER